MPVYYIRDVEQTQEQIEKLTQMEFFNSNIHCMRNSFFKYFSNESSKNEKGEKQNHSLYALKNNTVFLSPPSNFDDPYDCNIYVDYNEFALRRICYYASLFGITVDNSWSYDEISTKIGNKVHDHFKEKGTNTPLFELSTENAIVSARQKIIQLSLGNEWLATNLSENSNFKAIIDQVIGDEFKSMQETANHFRVACFAQTPYSMLMWSHYSRNHQGFCIEYETPDYSEDNADIYHNLFPVIYTDTRTPLTELSINWETTGNLTDDDIWNIYKYGLLSKSIDWKYQQEWRLIFYDKQFKDENYNCKFFKIKKVYLGNRMSPKDRWETIRICQENNIPYTGVTIAPDQFKMGDCSILCEDCEKMKNT